MESTRCFVEPVPPPAARIAGYVAPGGRLFPLEANSASSEYCRARGVASPLVSCTPSPPGHRNRQRSQISRSRSFGVKPSQLPRHSRVQCAFALRLRLQEGSARLAPVRLARQHGGTVFVDRASSADAHRVSGLMSSVLGEGIVGALFPEGTSTNGSSVLRFHAALFESAIATREPVTAARISYSVKEGSVENDVCYRGTHDLSASMSCVSSPNAKSGPQ